MLRVFPNTPAAEAGFEPGDVITKFGGQKVKDRSELQALVERSPLDTKQDVEVLREGKRRDVAGDGQGHAQGFRRGRTQGPPEHAATPRIRPPTNPTNWESKSRRCPLIGPRSWVTKASREC